MSLFNLFLGFLTLTTSIYATVEKPTLYPIQYQTVGLSESLTTMAAMILKKQQFSTHSDPDAALKQAKHAIEQLLKTQGYFRYVIHSTRSKTKTGYHIVYRIESGPLLKITQLNVVLEGEGKNDTHLLKKIAALYHKQGDAFTTDNYRAIKKSLYSFLIDEGYIHATWVNHTATIDIKAYTTVIDLSLHTGSQYKIGKIQFSDTPFDHHFLRQYLTIQPGQNYCLSKLLHTQTQLKKSGYFKDVYIDTAIPSSKISSIPIQLTPAPQYYTVFGLNCSTELGIHLKLKGLIRYLNAKGHQLAVLINASTQKFGGHIAYTLPGRLPITQRHHVQIEYNNYHQFKWIHHPTIIASYIYDHQYAHWHWLPSLSIQYESFQSTEKEKDQHYWGIVPSLNLNAKQLNFSHQRYYYQIMGSAKGALTPLSSLSFLSLQGKGIYLYHLKSLMPYSYLIVRGRLTTLLTSNFSEIPPSLRFHAGGQHYPRGHYQYDLGQHTVGGSLEARIHLKGLFFTNPFIDMHYNHSQKMINGSIGMGVCLWYPKIGHIEMDGVIRIHPQSLQSRYGLVGRISTDLY